MSYIQVSNITKSYRLGNKDKVQVLHGINVSFEKGEFVSILGESGSGKSTLMNIIGGMDRDFEGSVAIEGKDLRDMTEKELDAYRKLKIGFIFQSFNLISHLSVLDNVLMTMQLTSMNKLERTKKATEILTELGLGNHLNKKPNQLSGGQKQRVAIARALSNDPDIILADEPTGALDKKNSEQIMQLLDQIAAKGKLVITVTHSQKVADYGTRIITMDDGKIVKDEELRAFYTGSRSKKMAKPKNLGFGAAMKMATKNVSLNLKRNALVSFGGAIGILSVILMLGLGSGVTNYINKEINANLNPNLIQVTKAPEGRTDKAQSPLPNPAQQTVPLTDSDLDEVKELKYVKSADKVFTLTMGSSVNYQDTSVSIVQFQTMNDSVVKSDVTSGSLPKDNEILLSDTAAKKITDSPNKLVGSTVEFYVNTTDEKKRPIILSKEMKVSGIIKGAMNQDLAYTTYKTLEDMYSDKSMTLQATQLDIMVEDQKHVDAVTADLEKAGFTGTGVGNILSQVTNYLNIATYVLASVAGISLLVSAIMTIVVLYISVVERTKEIGILRAVGARRKDIKRIFFAEATVLGLTSGVIGVLIAAGIGALGNNVMHQIFDAKLIHISPFYMLVGILISVVISILAAMLPATKAAKLDPMESLRYE
ncbi:ATP-binding cassette domain-containing protein [Ectobacillus antri]|jgi:putative ABC transport system permease protein|uniref:ATP-binding cassette domain-containing protein n=1 Tax=Ectobacillus antri TaxID=2486280 RepID=A0ABT6H4V8_9BACI|nr:MULTISPECIES: ABC transporter ATP-binding protein/permease [Ectobacillus]MDG4657252.1 ATP-binding cassette domain-containing protein [Ectobacillus antri]MDG5754396.1 ATP-binding cassette domain-containing protein [Ectobacillus antri]UOY91770.1 ATP-binding cassette domain-containing protein [Ectobacillus sp. JY-23]